MIRRRNIKGNKREAVVIWEKKEKIIHSKVMNSNVPKMVHYKWYQSINPANLWRMDYANQSEGAEKP